MAGKTANVVARVEPDIKAQAESIMEQLGLSASAAINMFYRQVIYWNGLPFRPSIPMVTPKSYDELTKEEFDSAMAIGLAQAKAGQSAPTDKVFDRLIEELANG